MSKPYGRGGLTDADRAKIEELAGEGHSAGQIARQIQRHQSTVYWYMITQGLIAPRPGADEPSSYVRNGRTVHRFTRDEDVLIETLRRQEFSLVTIAEQCSKRFSTSRTPHAIKVRLIMLAAREDANA